MVLTLEQRRAITDLVKISVQIAHEGIEAAVASDKPDGPVLDNDRQLRSRIASTILGKLLEEGRHRATG